jgi:BirA family biotin operon repressor/biotin-[acetyl-CoA-carboxylase] ligase
LSPSEAKTPIGQPFMELAVVESTNIYAMDLLQANLAGHGTAVFAQEQTAGKGQRGKSWTGEPGLNIALSVILDCSSLTITQQFPLSSMVALACHDFFSRYAGDETRIKWPNDLYWRDRKAGGILIENLIRGNKWQGSVAGIGININQTAFSDLLKNPVSLKQITGKTFPDTTMLARELCACLEKRWQQLKKGDQNGLLLAYNRQLYKRGQEVRLKTGSIAFQARVEEVTADGELRVSGGLQDLFRFGELEWVI